MSWFSRGKVKYKLPPLFKVVWSEGEYYNVIEVKTRAGRSSCYVGGGTHVEGGTITLKFIDGAEVKFLIPPGKRERVEITPQETIIFEDE